MEGASAIDLAIASDPIAKEVKTFTVNNPVTFSKHCRIELRLKNMITLPSESEDKTYTWIELGDKFKWQDDSKLKFQEALNHPRVLRFAEECGQYLDAGLVESASEKIINMYLEAAKLSLEVKKSPRKNRNSNAFKHKKKWKKWFDQDCRNQKKHYQEISYPQALAAGRA